MNYRKMNLRLKPEATFLMVVDVQTRLLPQMWEAQRVERNCALLARVARQLQLPVIVTEQNPSRIGGTTGPVAEALGEFSPVEKMRFSAWPDTQSQIGFLKRKTVLVCGIEAHICVTQTALDLIENDYTVFVARDAVSSRLESNLHIGWERMSGAGTISSSTEAAIFELLGAAGTNDFRAVLPFLK